MLILVLLVLLFSPWPTYGIGAGLNVGVPVDPDRSHVQQIQERGFLWVRCFPQQISPFLSVDTSQGAMPEQADAKRFQGVDIEVLQRLASRLKVELRLHPGSEPTISSSFDDLERGFGDLVAGGLTMTAGRQKRFTFSAPYFHFRDLVLGPASKDRPPRPLTESRLAVSPGSSFDENVHAAGVPEERIGYFEFLGEGYESLVAGVNDFAFSDSTMMNPDELLGVRVAYQLEDQKSYGYVLPKGSDLKVVLDQMIQDLSASGELEQILRKYQAYGSVDLTDVPTISWQDFVSRR